jgi:hypothetical protein
MDSEGQICPASSKSSKKFQNSAKPILFSLNFYNHWENLGIVSEPF